MPIGGVTPVIPRLLRRSRFTGHLIFLERRLRPVPCCTTPVKICRTWAAVSDETTLSFSFSGLYSVNLPVSGFRTALTTRGLYRVPPLATAETAITC